MKILIACEFSGIIRDAFIARGHDAISCDLLPSERPGPHLQQDVKTLGLSQFDMMIAHPPCTHLATSGARWFKDKPVELQTDALDFVKWLMNAPVEKIAVENPVSIISTQIRMPDQVINPYQFGHTEKKRTCLWLKNLPPLMATLVMVHRNQTSWHEHPGPDQGKNRSRTFTGIAEAMAVQWG